MKSLWILLAMFVLHTVPYWFVHERTVGAPYDALAHAAMPEWYCTNVLTGKLQSDRFLAPTGVSLATNYDSPFPLILTCPLLPAGGQVQFHFFAALQILLIILTSWLVSRLLFRETSWQVAYVLFCWWTGFYFFRVQEHLTLLSGLWGFQLLLWCSLTAQLDSARNLLLRGLLIGLIFSGTFHNVAMLSFPAILFLGWVIWRQAPQISCRVWLRNLGIGIVAALLVFGVLFGPSIVAFLTRDLPRLPSQRELMSLDLASPFLPWLEHPAYEWFSLPKFEYLEHEKFNSLDLLVMLAILAAAGSRAFWRRPGHALLMLMAVLSFWFSLGRDVHWLREVVATNPLENWIRDLPPFSLSRSPARFFSVSVLALTYLAFAHMSSYVTKNKKWALIGWALVAWAIVTGPLLNHRVFAPTLELGDWLPRAALAEIKASPPETIVAHLPLALELDQAQNFLQLFHEHRINAGYLSYTTYTPETLAPILEDPFWRASACPAQGMAWAPPFGGDPEALRSELKKRKIGFLIINEKMLGPDCGPLVQWMNTFADQKWLRLVEHKAFYGVYAVE